MLQLKTHKENTFRLLNENKIYKKNEQIIKSLEESLINRENAIHQMKVLL